MATTRILSAVDIHGEHLPLAMRQIVDRETPAFLAMDCQLLRLANRISLICFMR